MNNLTEKEIEEINADVNYLIKNLRAERQFLKDENAELKREIRMLRGKDNEIN